MWRRIAPILAVIVILLIFYRASADTAAYEDYLRGLWVAEDDAFCEEADISSMMLYIGDSMPDGGWFGGRTRACHLIIMDDKYNGGFSLRYRPPRIRGIGCYVVHCDAPEYDPGCLMLWDGPVEMQMDMTRGLLKIYCGDELVARLYKSHYLSEITA